jgi:hypothetical protein
MKRRASTRDCRPQPSYARHELDDARLRFGHEQQGPLTIAVALQFPEERGGAVRELFGGKRPVAVVPPERREDLFALHVPRRTHVP